MSGHTPGPWTIFDGLMPDEIGGVGVLATDPADGLPFIVAAVLGVNHHADRDQQSEANARLIAAAPELLEALKSSRELNSWAMECFGFDADLSSADAAIAKATGASA